MKKLITFLLVICSWISTHAQVTKNVVAEHFTNTYCSICASNNPGLYTNLNNFPQVLHIAYHPSAPYTACPLNQHNKTENDARTNFYGVYGSTPRLVVQGKVVSGSLTNASIFQSELGQTTAFDVKVVLKELNSTSFEVRAVVTKKAASAISSLNIYAAIVEDTLFFNANNGETVHHDVFRKSAWGSQPVTITMPSNIGDSTTQTQIVNYNSTWNKNRLYAIAILQDGSKNAVQAAKSSHVATTTSIEQTKPSFFVKLFPNPVHDYLTIDGAFTQIVITNTLGETVLISTSEKHIDVSVLQTGFYNMQVYTKEGMSCAHFVKN